MWKFLQQRRHHHLPQQQQQSQQLVKVNNLHQLLRKQSDMLGIDKFLTQEHNFYSTVFNCSVTGPAVHRLLEQFGLSASEVPATGPKGNLLKGDILNLVNQKGLQPKAPKSGNLYLKH
jgi:hypothetical protein